jgi:hypothetical protein
MEVPAGRRTDGSDLRLLESGWLELVLIQASEPTGEQEDRTADRAAIKYALASEGKALPLTQGQLMNIPRGAFFRRGSSVPRRVSRKGTDSREGKGLKFGRGDLVIKDVIADPFSSRS